MRSSLLLGIEMTPGINSGVDSCCLCCLTSISLQIIKGTDLLWEIPPTGYRQEGSFMEGLALLRPSHTSGELEL